MYSSILRISQLLFWSILLSSCARTCTESALSDVVLSEPELLQVEMNVDKDLSDMRAPTASIRVFVRDKNGQALSLRDGGVSMGERTCALKRTLLTNLPYYFADETIVNLTDDKQYALNVRLGDGSVYTSVLNLPKDNLREFNVPEKYKAGSDLTVRWNELNKKYNAWLTWEKTMVRDTVTQTTSDRIALSPGSTYKTFPAAFFTDEEFTVQSIVFIIEVEMKGEVHRRFRAESFLISRFSASRRMLVNQPPS